MFNVTALSMGERWWRMLLVTHVASTGGGVKQDKPQHDQVHGSDKELLTD